MGVKISWGRTFCDILEYSNYSELSPFTSQGGPDWEKAYKTRRRETNPNEKQSNNCCTETSTIMLTNDSGL